MRRAALFFFYDDQGIADEYIFYMLQDLKKSLDKLYIVVNGEICEKSEERFKKIADEVYMRENVGFDVWAYKEGMERIGWDVIASYDEFIMMNHTNFGPVHPFKEMFDVMDARKDLDFWGITKHYGHDFDPYNSCEYGYIPAHIQSSFIAVRSHMLNSTEFRKYWDEMPMIKSYADSICKHEAVFTKHFSDLGFKNDVYVNTEDLKDVTDYPLMLMPTELVKNRHCPIFKRKTFYNVYEEFMDTTCGQPAVEFYNYLRNETDFPLDIIWDNLLRTANMWDIKQRMQLNYILPKSIAAPLKRKPKVALFMHLYYMDAIDTVRPYVDQMPEYADLYFSTDTEEKKKTIEKKMCCLGRKVTVVTVKNRGREYAGFLIGLRKYVKDYDYICIAHGKKSRYEKPYIIGDSFAYHCFENTLSSREFTNNVISTFEENPRLGLLVPPTPEHGVYFTTIGREWCANYPGMVEFLKQMNIHVPIDATKPPVAPLGGFYWFRSAALKKLFDNNFSYDDFPKEPCHEKDGTFMHVLERCYPFIAQDAGYYSAWVMSDNYAAMRVTNEYKTIRDINEYVFWVYGKTDRNGELRHIQEAISSDTEHHPMGRKKMIKEIIKITIGPKWCARCRGLVNRLKRSARK